MEQLLLVYPHGKSPELLTFCTMSPLLPPQNTTYVRDEFCMRDKIIIGIAHGWLILPGRTDDDGTIFSLFNPVTSQAMHLPPLDSISNADQVDICTLGLTSTDTDTIPVPCVIHLCFNSLSLLYSCPLTQLNCSWVARRFELEGKTGVEIRRLITLNNGILIGGGCRDTSMVLFGVASWHENHEWKNRYFTASARVEENHGNNESPDTLTLTPLQLKDMHLEMYHEYIDEYYVESCGRLYCAFLFIDNYYNNKKIISVKVGELDLLGNKWMEVDSLDGRAFFLGHGYKCSTTSWCWADTYATTTSSTTNSSSIGRPKESCLYFWHPLKSGEILYEYNMYDKSLTSICPCPNLASPHDEPFWLMTPGNQSNTRPLAFCEQGGEDGVLVKVNKQKKDGDLNGEQESRLMELLPFHMIECMSTYLHLFVYWSFRATCRLFRSAAYPTPSWITHNVYPLLVFFKNDAGLCSLMDPFRHDSRSSILPKLLPQHPFRVVFSNNGFLLTLAGKRALHFLNPFTGQTGKLTHADELFHCVSYAFSTSPSSPDCAILGVSHFVSLYLMFYYMKQGDENWSAWQFYNDVNVDFIPTSTTTPVFYHGSFYLLDLHGYLGEFSVVDGQPDWQILDKADTKDAEFDSSFLLKWDGKLCSVFIGVKGRVQVFQFDSSTEKKWREVKDLGDHVLFLSSASCFSITTSDVNLRNRIYLPRLKGDGIVYYSMDTHMYHVSGSESTNDLYHTKEPLKCCWI